MASILRSSKFVRYFAGVARSLVFNSTRGEIDGICIQNTQCLNNALTKTLATQAFPSRTTNDSNLDKSLKRLDQDVRRTGRISKRELEDVLGELRLSRSATSTQSLLIIRCCGNLVPEESPEVRTQLVQEIWKTLENIGVPMDISHYNALLRVYLENEHSFSPTEFLANLEHKGVEPNRVTYQRLIARYCLQGDIEGATRILEFMREKQLPVNENVFNALIMGHSQADDMESATGILGVMQQAGLEPSADTYTTLLCGYAKKGDIDALLSTLEECDKKEIQLLDRDYMDIIYALAINNHVQHVDKIIERMRQTAGYNQDAVNLILRLINRGYEELGYKMLLTMPSPSRSDGEQGLTGMFFIRQLVKANRPVEVIVDICKRLEEDNLNHRGLYVATECSLHHGNVEQACKLLQAMKDKELPIRAHYFWPLLAKHSKDVDVVLNILSRMYNEFGMSAGLETLRDYVIPLLQKKSSDEIIMLLKGSGASVASAATSLVSFLLMNNDLAEAAKVASRYRAHYSSGLLRRPIVQAYVRTDDIDSFITLLRQVHDSADRVASIDEDTPASVPDRAEIVGQFVVDVAAVSRSNKITRIEAILQALVEQGLCMSNSAAERIQERLGEGLTSEISTLLGKLTAGDLVPTSVSRPSAVMLPMDENQLLKLQKVLEEKGESIRGVKRQLFTIYCRSKDLEKVEQLMKELEADEFVFTGGMYAQLIELYCHHENVEQVLQYVSTLKEKEPDFALDDSKIIKVAALLIKNNRTPEALKFLSEQSRERKPEERGFQYNAICWRALNSLAEEGKVTELKEVFDTLVKYEYMEVNNVLLGPLIKVHIVRNDLSGAMEQFEQCCQNYRSTPWKNELACKLIQAEDAVSLQKLTDLSTQIHGEVNSLYDLVFAFVECGRIRQARKILETPGLRSRPHRLNSACERYRQEGMVAPLEGLVEATRDISHIDRSDIYYHLLLSYCTAKDPDKALGLWTRMQEEDVQPSDEFLVTLADFLKEEGLNVPFVVPEGAVLPKPSEETSQVQGTQEKVSQPSLKIRQALRQNDLEAALEIKQKSESSGETLSVTELSSLIEGLVKAERYGEASRITQGMLVKDLYPLPRTFRFLLNRLATSGDVDSLTALGNNISSEKKKIVSFDNKLCEAYIIAGRGHEYLKKLAKGVERINDSNRDAIAEQFPRGGSLGILQKHPELTSEFEEMAVKYAEKGIIAPINMLWMHMFVIGEHEAANKLWEQHLAQAPRIMFQHVLQTARMKQDESIPRTLLQLVQKTSLSEGGRGNIHSCHVDILISKEKIDEAFAALKEAVDEVCLENINRTALFRLKTAVEKTGKSFPYEIPPKNAKSSTSSSSSSDDEPSRPARQ